MPETPLTKEERKALKASRLDAIHRAESGTRPAPHSHFNEGWLAARDFYSERERELRGLVERVVAMENFAALANPHSIADLAAGEEKLDRQWDALVADARAALEATDG